LDSSIVPSIQKREEKIFCHSSFNSDCIADSIDMGTSKDGGLDGLWTWWYENGQKEEEGTFKDGKEDGLLTEWYENGQKSFEGTWKDGEYDGKSTTWYEKGQKMAEGTYKDKELIEATYWDEDGNKQ